MNEALRLHYLDALGIDQFVPTRILPNSAELRVCELPLATRDDLSDQGADTVSENAQRVLPQAASGLHQLIDNPAIGNNGARAPEADAPGTSVERPTRSQPRDSTRSQPQLAKGILEELDLPEQSNNSLERNSSKSPQPTESVEQIANPAVEQISARFQLAIWYLENISALEGGLLVIDSHEPRSALPTESLLANILLSKRLLNLQLPRVSFLSWPLSTSEGDHSWDAARDYVSSFVEARTQQSPLKACIAMGDDALHALGAKGSVYEVNTSTAYAAPILSLPSLVQILHEPACKASVWRSLNALF